MYLGAVVVGGTWIFIEEMGFAVDVQSFRDFVHYSTLHVLLLRSAKTIP